MKKIGLVHQKRKLAIVNHKKMNYGYYINKNIDDKSVEKIQSVPKLYLLLEVFFVKKSLVTDTFHFSCALLVVNSLVLLHDLICIF